MLADVMASITIAEAIIRLLREDPSRMKLETFRHERNHVRNLRVDRKNYERKRVSSLTPAQDEAYIERSKKERLLRKRRRQTQIVQLQLLVLIYFCDLFRISDCRTCLRPKERLSFRKTILLLSSSIAPHNPCYDDNDDDDDDDDAPSTLGAGGD
jgi:hypothetical protein